MTDYRPFSGHVVHGKHMGRTLGFPTANLDAESTDLARGVYAVRVRLESGEEKMGMMNVGRHPTLPDGPATVEINLLDFEGDLYGQALFVEPAAFLRGEVRFESLDALRAQLARDRETVRALLSEDGISPNDGERR